MSEQSAFSELLNLIAYSPYRWMLTFKYDRGICLEYFGDGYVSDLERGAGNWEAIGSIEEVTQKARAFVQSLMLVGEWN